jgi:hypothetical protein
MRALRSSSAVQALSAALRPKPRLVKRECRTCGNWHTGAYGGCKLCLEIERLRGELWRKGQKKKGLCVACVEKKDRGSGIRCTHHLAYDNEWQQARYADQRAQGLCGYARCQTASESYFCDEHRTAFKAAARSSRRGLRRASRRA